MKRSTATMILLSPHERFVRRTALLMMLSAAILSSGLAVFNLLRPASHLIDFVVPPVLAVVFLILFLHLLWRPESFQAVLRIGFGALFLAFLGASWIFTWQATGSPTLRLVDIYPPITSMIFLIIMGMIVFLRTREILLYAGVCWLLAVAPILLYLVLHPEELMSPRGLDMVITLGPTVVVILVLVVFHDGLRQLVDLLQHEKSHLKRQSERDSLTGLYNRRAGERQLSELAEGGGAVEEGGAILFDIDHFKRINDTHGHAQGDEVLRGVAAHCLARLRRHDVCIRWGGEEFLVLIADADEEALGHVAEQLREGIAAETDGPVGRVTASFGVTAHRTGDSVESILARVDRALYAAKRAGRNRVEVE